MWLKKFNKNVIFIISFFCLLGIGVIWFGDDVEAAGVEASVGDPKVRVCYNRETGAFLGSYEGTSGSCNGNGRDTIKYIDNNYAYCVNWRLEYGGPNYEKNTSWVNTSKNAIMAGYIVNYVNNQGFDKAKAYARTGATLNTLFNKYNNDAGSYNYYSDSEISGYITGAENYYKTVKLTKSLPSITLSYNGSSLNYNETSKKYFSDKITASGFVATFGGNSDTTLYKITATTSGGQAVDICTGSSGTGCNTTVSLSGRSNDYSFYLYVAEDKVSVGDTITVKVSGSNSSKYYTSILYNNLDAANAQKLLVVDTITFERTVSKTMLLTIPDLVNHRIRAYKVDENGDILNGATLEIYKDDPSVSGNLLATNNGNGYEVIYTAPTVIEGEDDFFEHDYYLVEKSGPNGFVYSSINKFYLKGTGSEKGLSCYYNGGSESNEFVSVDEEFCYPERYEYKCKTPSGELWDVNASGNCEFSNESNLEQSGTEGDGTIHGDLTEIETQGDEATTDATENGSSDLYPTVVYEKVCYNKDKAEIVDAAYCSNKESYTKVWNGNDGNITVKHMNSRNVVRVSKQSITGEAEVVGASLKICTASDYNVSRQNCTPAKTIDGVEMSWISDEASHSIYGLPIGSYYIVEVTPPNGYLQATIATEFSIDEKGDVKTGNKTIANSEFVKATGAIVIKNTLSKITISKQDIVTSKELPGATISICRTYIDEDGEIKLLVDQYTGDCIEAVLADGTTAIWKSTNEPKIIEGLPTGTYYLVERIAPTDYSTAESILFTLNSDGTLADANGESLKNNKLVMYDEPLENKKTGSINTYIVIGGVVLMIIIGGFSFWFLKKK